jgi:hypothetical protein
MGSMSDVAVEPVVMGAPREQKHHFADTAAGLEVRAARGRSTSQLPEKYSSLATNSVDGLSGWRRLA